MNNIVYEKCVQSFAKVFEVDPAIINDDTSPANLEQWDSLGHVSLIVELEKTFSLQVNPDEIIDLDSFKAVFNWVNHKINGTGVS
jgi:acyl carrier protein